MLPPNHAFTLKLIEYKYIQKLHVSFQIVLSTITQKFWSIKCKELDKTNLT